MLRVCKTFVIRQPEASYMHPVAFFVSPRLFPSSNLM